MGEPYPGETREDAFHVTATTSALLIAAHGFRVDRRGVLGSGAYFDIGTHATGWEPARRRYPEEALVVLRCRIHLGRVLDLDDGMSRAELRTFQRELVQRMGREPALALGQGGQIDLFLQRLAAAGEIFHSVRRTFAKDGRTRVSIRESWRIEVLAVEDEWGEETAWPPPNE